MESGLWRYIDIGGCLKINSLRIQNPYEQSAFR